MKLFGRITTILILFICTGAFLLGGVGAEQTGDSPESGTTSKLKELYEFYRQLGQGSEGAGDWGDHGSIWNRIYSERVDYSRSAFVEYDDEEDGDSEAEESSWSNTATNVWQDQRTGFYWSNSQGQSDNIFPDQDHTACPFFALSDRGGYDGLDADCGNAINTCGTLSLERVTGEGVETDWYLPSQKELLQAYIDGVYNQTSAAFATTYYFWSSTEYSDNSVYAWTVDFNRGFTYVNSKPTAARYVRCVRRD